VISPADAPRLGDYARIIRRGWLVIVCATVLSTGVGWLAWQTTTPVYDSSSRVIVKSMGDATPLDALYGQINAESRVLTYQYLARSARVTGPTVDQLRLPQTIEDLAGRISIPPSLTPVLDIVVKGTDPDETREVANAVTANLIAVSGELAKVDGGGTELVLVDQAGPAKREGSLVRDLVQAGVIGVLVSLVLVLAWGLVQDQLLGRRQLGRVVHGGGPPA
jgi:capsular polysaccharide biosynthesis protein